MRTLDSPRAGIVTRPLSINEGGTGATDETSAVSSLGLISQDAVDQPGGIAGLNQDGRLDLNTIPDSFIATVSLKGTPEVTRGGTVALAITNYDRFTNYQLSALNGSVSRIKDQIFFTASNIAGIGSVFVNGKRFDIEIVNERPNAPTLSVTHGRGPSANAILYLQGSVFGSPSGTQTHISSDWQVATDIGFSNIVASSSLDTVNKTAWQSTPVSLSATFYARVRYRGSDATSSNWSNVVTVTTSASYPFNTEEAKLAASDRVSNDISGYAVAISADGSRVVMGSPQSDPDSVSNSGAVYVFVRNGLSWTQEAKLTANDKAASNFLGRAVAISDNGDRVAAAAPGNNSGNTNQGAVYVWRKESTNWIFEQKLSAPDGVTNDYFGDLQSIALDSTASKLVVGVRNSDPSGVSNAGAVYIYSRTTNTWTQEAKITAPTPGASFLFGQSVSISADGLTLVVGSVGNSVNESGYGEQIYQNAGTFSFTVPAGVFSLSMVAVGAGAGALNNTQAGGAGALSYKNSFPVQPGDQFTVTVGAGGAPGQDGGQTIISKVGGGLTIICPGGNTNGTGSNIATGGDFNNAGAQGTYSSGLIQTGPSTGYIFMGGSGMVYYTVTAPNQPTSEQTGGAVGPGTYVFNGINYTVYQGNSSNFSASLYGQGQNGLHVGYGGPVFFSTIDQTFYAGFGGNGGVRFVWGSGKTYPTNAIQSSSQGAAFVFNKVGQNWTAIATLLPSALFTNSEFGYSVAVSADGQRIAVSARNMPNGSGRGTVFVFRNVSGTWTEEAVINGSSRATNDYLGQSVSLNADGSLLAIGEFQARQASNVFGAFYVYQRSGTIWLENSKNFASDAVSNGALGHSVAVSKNGLRVVAGSTGAQFSATAMGAAYIYR